ncbi:hypothetical protein KGF56_004290 [Candida oxycetoniae]|uniref:BHLH domain-containing protein n=1 Tax=Candida oxycetoniae TaxID=497107 RepID=A0AAI9WWK1_9ASCO|nr:uncharacterized protein KGF56_004290 [Candida oxycetoniae]KAI3402829.2 hypothetical protein KGF56_004290 [Candida oxycetoniae]
MTLPSPPVLKTTIIQLNKELNTWGYEILTNEYNNPTESEKFIQISSPESIPNKKKRRRCTANINSEELAKRKNETKQLHSIIEKRRRIKINREFEALKYLIPACRYCNDSPSSKKPAAANNNNNNNKIDGMYKLTILKSSVEYILYLHHIIQKQHELLSSENLEKVKNFDIGFAKVPLDVNQYRNIDIDFNFKDLMKNEVKDETRGDRQSKEVKQLQKQSQKQLDDNKPSLPTPEFTPDMAPILTLLNTYTGENHYPTRNNSYAVSPHTIVSKSGTPNNKATRFTLPDPAINPLSEVPRNTFSKIDETIKEVEEKESTTLSDRYASKTLLALRKSSIDSLLN